MVFLKVTDGNETRRFQVTSELTFDQLRERLIKLFPSLGKEKDLLLKYRDADGDLITLSSNEELQEVTRRVYTLVCKKCRDICLCLNFNYV